MLMYVMYVNAYIVYCCCYRCCCFLFSLHNIVINTYLIVCFVCLFVCLLVFIHLSIYPSIYLSIYIYICICTPIHLSLCVHTYTHSYTLIYIIHILTMVIISSGLTLISLTEFSARHKTQCNGFPSGRPPVFARAKNAPN